MTDIGVPDEEDLASTNKSYIIEKTKQELSAAGRDVRNMSDEELESSAKAVADRIGTKISAKDFGPRFSVQRDKQQGISFKREKDFNIGQQVRGTARMQEPPQAFFEKVPEAIADAISRINQQRITGASVTEEQPEPQDVSFGQAFAKARREGKETFEFNDKLFTTQLKEETRKPLTKPTAPQQAEEETKPVEEEKQNVPIENLTLKTLAEEMQKLQANKTTETKKVEEETKPVEKETKEIKKEKETKPVETKKTKEDLNYEKISNQFKTNKKALTIRQLNFLLNTTRGTKEERDKVRKELNSRPKKGLLDFLDNVFNNPEVLEEVKKEQEISRKFREQLTQKMQLGGTSESKQPTYQDHMDHVAARLQSAEEAIMKNDYEFISREQALEDIREGIYVVSPKRYYGIDNPRKLTIEDVKKINSKKYKDEE